MRRGVIPRHINFRDPSPDIPWQRLPLQVTAEPTPWPRRPGCQPLAGVSGFGWSGTNAHIILEGYGPTPTAAVGKHPPQQWFKGPPRQVIATASASGLSLGKGGMAGDPPDDPDTVASASDGSHGRGHGPSPVAVDAPAGPVFGVQGPCVFGD